MPVHIAGIEFVLVVDVHERVQQLVEIIFSALVQKLSPLNAYDVLQNDDLVAAKSDIDLCLFEHVQGVAAWICIHCCWTFDRKRLTWKAEDREVFCTNSRRRTLSVSVQDARTARCLVHNTMKRTTSPHAWFWDVHVAKFLHLFLRVRHGDKVGRDVHVLSAVFTLAMIWLWVKSQESRLKAAKCVPIAPLEIIVVP